MRIKLSKFRFLALALPLSIILTGCKMQPEPTPNSLDDDLRRLNLQALPNLPEPYDNRSTAEKVELGKILFWDPVVGGEKDVACATCHHPDFGYADGLDLPIGVGGQGLGPSRRLGAGRKRVPRNSPSILNTAYNGMTSVSQPYNPKDAVMFWDGRAESLEIQCTKPPTSQAEMAGMAYGGCEECDMAMDSVVTRLKNIPDYVTLFDRAFGGGANAITEENYGKAIAAFERTLSTPNSRFDRYVRGESAALNTMEKEGALLFFGKAKCGSCHFGPMFSDWEFYALGVEDNPARPELPDWGKDSVFKFRTPTLRNVTLTAPYMHSGMHETLEEVVQFYNEGVSRNPYVEHPEGMEPLGLSPEEVDQVVAFMETLTDERFDKTIPSFVPSGLPVGGEIDE